VSPCHLIQVYVFPHSTDKIQIYRKKPPQRISRWSRPSKKSTYCTHLAGFLSRQHVTLGSVQYPRATVRNLLLCSLSLRGTWKWWRIFSGLLRNFKMNITKTEG
jgi:hypothetical protein